tara:strand:+ start:133 stop:462 length:330 start_codon:yes stop_codon:yes gene_type:complete
MANTFKSITSGSIGTTLVDVYTCPVSTTTIILGASIANIDNNPIGGSIKLAKSGSGDDVFIVKQAPVPVGSTVEVMSGNKVVLEASDTLQFQSDTAGSMDTIVSLLEIS